MAANTMRGSSRIGALPHPSSAGGDDGSGQERAELEAHHRDHRDERIGEDVFDEQRRLRNAFRARRHDIVVRHDFQETAPNHARQLGREGRTEGEGGQNPEEEKFCFG